MTWFQLTLNEIPGVQALTQDELKGIELSEDEEDIVVTYSFCLFTAWFVPFQKDVVKSLMDAPLPQQNNTGHAREREVTVDVSFLIVKHICTCFQEVTDQASSGTPIKRAPSSKAKKSKRVGQKKSPSAGLSREA